MLSLSEDDRRALLGLAREAVSGLVAHGRLLEQIPGHGIFCEKRGAFVTLHVHHQLRGCIGVPEPRESLGHTIVHCAISAAVHDPRFSPLATHELSSLQIEISLLSSFTPLRIDEIDLGRHGLLVVRGAKSGLLLPQVASDHGLSKERFLEEACRKAELPLNAWRDSDVQILGFTAEVISDQLGTS